MHVILPRTLSESISFSRSPSPLDFFPFFSFFGLIHCDCAMFKPVLPPIETSHMTLFISAFSLKKIFFLSKGTSHFSLRISIVLQFSMAYYPTTCYEKFLVMNYILNHTTHIKLYLLSQLSYVSSDHVISQYLCKKMSKWLCVSVFEYDERKTSSSKSSISLNM